MKIVNLRTLRLLGPRIHSVGGVSGTFSKLIVRIDADNGLYGLGEVENYFGAREALDYLSQFIIGRNPLDITSFVSEILYGTLPPHTPDQVTAENNYSGIFEASLLCSPTDTPRGPIMWALSGVAMAMCDLAGKALGIPAYRLLGGNFRNKIRVYLDRSSPTGDQVSDIDAWRRMGADSISDGFTQIKFDAEFVAPEFITDVWNRSMTTPQINKTFERLLAVREEVGWDVDICVDCHGLLHATDAIRLAEELAPLKLKWIEDPTSFEDIDACVRVRERTSIPVCVGEVLIPGEARLWIDAGACDIIHPDILFCGGPHEMRKIGECAELHSIPIAMHGNGGSLATIAAAHVAAACRNFIGLEYHFIETDWVGEIVSRDGLPLFVDGHVQLTEKPGFGVELNKEVCSRNLAPGESLFA